MDTINSKGKAFITHTKVDGLITLRMSIGQTNTKENHVRETLGNNPAYCLRVIINRPKFSTLRFVPEGILLHNVLYVNSLSISIFLKALKM